MIQSNRNATSKQTESPKRQFSIKKEAIAASSEIIEEEVSEEDDSRSETNENPIESLKRELVDSGRWLEANIASPEYKEHLFSLEVTIEKLKLESPNDSLIPYYEKKLVEWKKRERKINMNILLVGVATILFLLAVSLLA